MGIMPNMLNFAKIANSREYMYMFPENIWKSSWKMWKLDILSAKSISVTRIKWKWCPIHWNWPNIANSGKFPDFQKISGKIPEKLEFWNSDFKIKLSDLNWVGKIPNILKLAKTSQFPGVSRFPDSQFPNSRNFQMPPKVAKN